MRRRWRGSTGTRSLTGSPSRKRMSSATSSCSEESPSSSSSSALAAGGTASPRRGRSLRDLALANPYWEYARKKIACEDAPTCHRDEDFRRRSSGPPTLRHRHPGAHRSWTEVHDRRSAQDRKEDHHSRRGHFALDDDARRRLREGAAGCSARVGGRRGLPHHLRRGPHLEPDLRRPPPTRRATWRRRLHPDRGYRGERAVAGGTLKGTRPSTRCSTTARSRGSSRSSQRPSLSVRDPRGRSRGSKPTRAPSRPSRRPPKMDRIIRSYDEKQA